MRIEDIRRMGGVGGLLVENATHAHRASSPLMPPLSEIAAIILAAGLSSRFEGGPEETKLVVLPFRQAFGPSCRGSGARLACLPDPCRHRPCTQKPRPVFHLQPDYRTGLASSLKAGIAALPETAAGALILLADMPWFR
jgi:molybdenum cofactor cytidylyltransferase